MKKRKYQSGGVLSDANAKKLQRSSGDISSLGLKPLDRNLEAAKNNQSIQDIIGKSQGFSKAPQRTQQDIQNSNRMRKQYWDEHGVSSNSEGNSPDTYSRDRAAEMFAPAEKVGSDLADWANVVAPIEGLTKAGIEKGIIKSATNESMFDGLLNQFRKPVTDGELQVKKGNEWLRNWYSDKNIQQRYYNFINHPKQGYIDLDVTKALNNYEDLVHHGNDIVQPDFKKADLGLLPRVFGEYNFDTNEAKVFVNNARENSAATAVHEGIHKLTMGNNAISDDKTMGLYTSFNRGDNPNEFTKYITDPTEVHARIGELRYHYGMKPSDQVSYDKAKNIIKEGLAGETPVHREFFKRVKGETNLARLFNTLPAAAPVAVGAGVAASQNKENGGAIMAKSGIHIKPENRGKFNATKKATGKSTEELTHSKNPVTKKRAIFAQNASHWNHAQNGAELPTAYSSAPRPYYEQAEPINTNLQQNDVALGMLNSGVAPISASSSFEKSQSAQQLTDMNLNMRGTPNTQQGVAEANSNIYGDAQQKRGYDGRYGKAALAGLLAVDALIPNKKPKYPVVRPSLSYNEHPYGTGSSALYDDGGVVSNSGYKSNSPDRFNSSLRVPSNQITMDNVPHPVYGVDDQGNEQMMYPGEQYEFPGEYVDEYPVRKMGGPVGQYKTKHYQTGGPLPQQPRRLQPKEIDYFNNFNKFVDSSGYAGSPKLNNQEFSKGLYSQYQAQNPSELTYEQLIPMAQQEQALQKDFDVDIAKRKIGVDKAQQLQNAPITKYDGMYGPLTQSRNIPIATQTDKVNGRVVRDTTLGYVPNTINNAGPAPTSYKKPVPKDAEIVETEDGKGYYDPTYGNFVKLRNGGSIKTFNQGTPIQYKKGTEHDLSSEEIQSLLAKGYKLKMK